ncbi:hypothetical protein K435DRAFT_785537 [Dendrothele bispora CBS 962.96]|uniref:Uncharacterized protein n=1 Tax=Dendrothele bispora (strain CBS 962.96) TaxID=1314807 RepID=A0A4S8KWH5_DENBC|nr:hypothetical protein K435DRAFT_785537 [Dendrothele bispora CBS 962.96]
MLLLQSYLSFFLLISPALAVLVNRTIDDTIQDSSGNSVQYSPNEPGRRAWNVGGCSQCAAKGLDTTQLFDKTWHDGTYNPDPGSNDFPNVPLNASFSFTGTAIYVFCAIAKTTTNPTGNSDMSFYIDDVLSGTFVKQAPGVQGYDYNVLVYKNESLSPGQHNFRLQNGHVNGTKSLVLLDKIVYTFDDGSDSSTASPSSGRDETPSTSSSSSASPSTTNGNSASRSRGKGGLGTMSLASLTLLVVPLVGTSYLLGFWM